MKKLISVLLALISVICVAFTFVGCGDDETAEKGNVSPVTDANQNSGNDKKLEEGKFYTVTEAYEKGCINREQLMSIAHYYNDGNFDKEGVDENYKPLPIIPERLKESAYEAIADSFYNSEYWEQYKSQHTKDDISYYYCGTYGNMVAGIVYVRKESIKNEKWQETVDGVTIYYRDSKRILIWQKTENFDDGLGENGFYTVGEAYGLGYITREDLMSVAYYYYGGVSSNNAGVMGENYTPLPKTPEKLSAETEAAIKQSYFNSNKEILSGEDVEIRIDEYYGTYHGCVAVMMSNSNGGFLDVYQDIEVDGIHFSYGNSNQIRIWKN